VPNCHNTTLYTSDSDKVMLHRLPVDKQQRNGWIRQLQNVRANLIINDNTRACSVHFVNLDSSNLPTLFPSKPPKEVKCRRLLDLQITDISDCTRIAASLSEECADALLISPKPNHTLP